MEKQGRGSRVVMAALPLALTLVVVAAAAGAVGSTDGARKATAKYRSLTTAKQHGYRVLKDKNGIA